MKWALRRYGSERDYFLFVFGINTGLRVSDMVPLTVGDVRGTTHVVIREKKTNKTKRFMLPVKLREEIEDYTAHMSDGEYLFASRKGNGTQLHPHKLIDYRALVKAGEVLGRDDIGTHTMRKTFGYAYYRRTKNLAFLQNIFNHSAPSITKRYIGITQDEIDETLKDFSL